MDPPVFCDERELAWMDNGRYFSVKVAPGKHVIRSEHDKDVVKLDARAGETYYVEVNLRMGKFKAKGAVTSVPKEKGEKDIEKLRPLAKKNVVATEVSLEPISK